MPRTRTKTADDQNADLEMLAGLLAAGTVNITQGRTSVRLPPALAMVLSEAVSSALRGETVTVISVDQKMTTQEAANLLGMSRQHLVRLLDAKSIKLRASKVGTHRRVSMRDVMRLADEKAAVQARAKEIAEAFEAAFSRHKSRRR